MAGGGGSGQPENPPGYATVTGMRGGYKCAIARLCKVRTLVSSSHTCRHKRTQLCKLDSLDNFMKNMKQLKRAVDGHISLPFSCVEERIVPLECGLFVCLNTFNKEQCLSL